MNAKNMAENLATTTRNLRDDVQALKAVLQKTLSATQLANLERAVLDEVTRVRSGEAYCESLALFHRQFDGANDAESLIRILYGEFAAESNVGAD